MSHRTKRVRITILAILCLALSHTINAANSDPEFDRPIIKGTTASVTVGDFKSDLMRLPDDLRASFALDSRRVAGSLNNLLTVKSLAAEARAQGLEKDPIHARAIQLATERVLAQLRLDALDKETNKEFDRLIDSHTKRAHELYLINKERHMSPEQVRAAHVLVALEKHSDAEAKALAEKIRAEALAGVPFEDLAKKHSADSVSRVAGGDLGYFDSKAMVKPFADAAFALAKEGEISPLVKTTYGYHVIKLLGRKPSALRPFEEVKGQILADMRNRLLQDVRAGHARQYHAEGANTIDFAVVESLHLKLDPESYRKATEKMLAAPQEAPRGSKN